MRTALIATGLAAALLIGTARAQDQGEGRPSIFLEKKVFAEDQGGRKSFFEVHAVEEGESLWKILARNPSFSAEEFGALLEAFRRANPGVPDPGRLRTGQRILVPSVPPKAQDPRVAEGRAVLHKVVRGDTLTKILARRGVSAAEIGKHIAAVQALNAEIRDPDLIYAEKTILLPAEAYSGGPAVAGAAPAQGPPTGEKVALSRAVPAPPGSDLPAARPGALLGPPPGAGASGAPVGVPAPRGGADNQAVGEPGGRPEAAGLPQPKPPYRGLLSDLARGLGEEWIDRGTLYLPVSAGGEIVLNLEEYPVVRFSSGVHVLLDFRGSLPPDAVRVIREAWPDYRIVDMAGVAGAPAMIDRLLGASGYHAVKDGRARPLVIGESVAVSVPAEWVVLRTERSLPEGEVILVKEVPEKPGQGLSAVLRYAGRVGIRVLPFAADPSAGEGFLVSLGGESAADPTAAISPGRNVPRGGLAAVDFVLDFLGLPSSPGSPVVVASPGNYRLTVTPDRVFEAGGRKYLVDEGKMNPALRALLRDAGHSVFEVGPDEPGRSVARRILDAAGIAAEERKEFLLAGGAGEGFEIRVTGIFLSGPWIAGRDLRSAAFVRGKVHGATRALLEDFGVEIAGW